jgi:hypothetical protein
LASQFACRAEEAQIMGVGEVFRKNAKTVPKISQIRDGRKVLDTSQARFDLVLDKSKTRDMSKIGLRRVRLP